MDDGSPAPARVRALDLARGLAITLLAFATYCLPLYPVRSQLPWLPAFGALAVVAGVSTRLGSGSVRAALWRAVLFFLVAWWCRVVPPKQPITTMFIELALWSAAGLALRRMRPRALCLVAIVSLAGQGLLESVTGRWPGAQATTDTGPWRHWLLDFLVWPFGQFLVMPIAGLLATGWLVRGAPRSGRLFLTSALAASACFVVARLLPGLPFWIKLPATALAQTACGLALLSGTAWLTQHTAWPRLHNAIAATGRLALSWSLLHIAVILELQQLADWPLGGSRLLAIGATAAMLPLLLSPLILRRLQRGPAEAVLHWLAQPPWNP